MIRLATTILLVGSVGCRASNRQIESSLVQTSQPARTQPATTTRPASTQPTTRPTSGPTLESTLNEVIVLGTIHERHRTSEAYGVARLKDLVKSIDPDYVLCEIAPPTYEKAKKQLAESRPVKDPRLRAFPEYTDVIFPLSQEMHFQIVPCAAETRAMSKEREQKLKEWETTRAEESKQVKQGMDRAETKIEAEGMGDNPAKIHTEEYDAIVQEGIEAYNRFFNADLGPAGWDNINAAHYALMAKALDEHRREGKRVLIMFGSWHKYWFLRELKKRDDIVLVPVTQFLKQVPTTQPSTTAPTTNPT